MYPRIFMYCLLANINTTKTISYSCAYWEYCCQMKTFEAFNSAGLNDQDFKSLCRYGHRYIIVVVCTKLNKPHIQVGMGRVVTSGSLGSVMVSTLAQNVRDVDSIPTLGTLFLLFITHMTLVAVTMILSIQLCAVWLLNLPCRCIWMVIACMYGIVSIKRLTIRWGRV